MTHGSSETQQVSWADGEEAPRPILVLGLDLPDGSGARTARLSLSNPTGGATIHSTRGVMSIVVFPLSWGAQLRALFLGLQALFGAFTPAWVLIFAAVVALAAHRSWHRVRRRARARA